MQNPRKHTGCPPSLSPLRNQQQQQQQQQVESRPSTNLAESQLPGDSRSWESPEKEDNVWRLFIQTLLVKYQTSPGM